ncbi:MAG: MarR family transcriptional regulator [Candidatus Verstraetearchaeota archaeon]|nr:MarR family transcriptional regulator [Candidatus Verstraetearchaeota archaeon]
MMDMSSSNPTFHRFRSLGDYSDLLLLTIGILIVIFSFLTLLMNFQGTLNIEFMLMFFISVLFSEVLGVMLIIIGVQFSLQKFLLRNLKIMDSLNKLSPREKDVLNLIVKNGGVILQSKLTDLTGYSQSRISGIISKLNELGLVQVKSSGDDNSIMALKDLKDIMSR